MRGNPAMASWGGGIDIMTWVRISIGSGHDPSINETTSSSRFGLEGKEAEKFFRILQDLLFYQTEELQKTKCAKEIWNEI